MVQFRSQSKITDPDLQSLSEKQVSEFQIAMDDQLILKILDSQRDLPEIIPRLNFSDSPSSFDELIKGLNSTKQYLIGTQLEYDIHIAVILKRALVFDHKLRFDRLVDFNFRS